MLLNSLLSAGPEWDPPEWYPVLFDSAKNIAGSVFFWLTVAALLAFVLCVFLIKGETRKRFFKVALIAAIGYACIVGITMLVLSFLEDGIVTLLFAPLVTAIAAVGAGAILLVLKRTRLTYIVAGCLAGTAVIAALVCMGVYYAQNIDADGYFNSEATGAKVNQIVLYVSSVLLLALVIALGFICDKGKKGFDSKSIAYAAVCIAMSFALSYIRIVKMPQGGSVTVASLLPLMIYSFMFGTKKGVFAGLVYGLLQAVQDPWIIHPAQFLLDYPIAFAGIGVAGMFARTKRLEKVPQVQFALGAVVASVLRFLAHILSGVFAFSAYAIEKGMNTWVYSLFYNSFVFLDIAIVIAAGVLVFSSKAFMKQVRKFTAPAKTGACVPAAAEGSAMSEDAAQEVSSEASMSEAPAAEHPAPVSGPHSGQ